MSEFLMPSLGADMEAGTLLEWLKKPGDALTRGDIIAVVETQKGAIEIEVFEDGVLARYLLDIGSSVPVGTPMAVIDQTGQDQPSPSVQAVQTAKSDTAPTETKAADGRAAGGFGPIPASASAPAATRLAERQMVTPAARRLARVIGVDLAAIKGSGPDGAVVLADVEMADASKTGSPTADSRSSKSPGKTAMRDAIAAAMARSKREIPHYYLSHTCDLTNANAYVADYNASQPPDKRLLIATLFMKAVARSVSKYPEFNGHFENGAYKAADRAHVGFAINIRDGGLVAPAIHDVAALDPATLMTRMRDLVARVRAGRFRAAELSDPTITISSLGERGVETLYGIIYPPQVAIVGFGMPVARPWVCEDGVQSRQTVAITLAADHRVSDGHRGALFLNAISKFLQEPETL
ncbi:MAG: 2-oxo acid dehydrogenase subunit E2 [Alphaproteobacteria bacterium]|nr:2-oxo acid dehydrogenase subunit E2 [Alphaproteobacteria bacterium]